MQPRAVAKCQFVFPVSLRSSLRFSLPLPCRVTSMKNHSASFRYVAGDYSHGERKALVSLLTCS